MRTFRILFYLLAVVTAACNSKTAGNTAENETAMLTQYPTQAQLLDNFFKQASMLIICNTDEGEIYQVMQEFIGKLKDFNTDFTFRLKKSSEITADDLQHNALYIVGKDLPFTMADTLFLPFEKHSTSFTFNTKNYEQTDDVLKIAFYPSPFNPQLPITLITGNSIPAIEDYVLRSTANARAYFLWDNWGYQVYRGGKRVILGNFSSNPENQWQIDKKEHWEFDYTGKVIRQDEKITFIDHNSGLSSMQMDSIIEKVVTNLGQTEYECGGAIKENVQYHIYASTEIKGLMLNNNEQVHLNFETNEVHAVFQNEFGNAYPASEAKLAVRQILGKARINALETGVSLIGKKNWGGTGCSYWAAKLLSAGAFPALSDIINNTAFANGSRLVMDCAAYTLVNFLKQEMQPQIFYGQYTNISAADILILENKWKAYLQNHPTYAGNTVAKQINGKQNGFNFAHEGYQVYNGYGGTTAIHAIERMQQIGTNAIAIIPYTGTGELTKPVVYPLQHGPGGENDEAVIHAMYQAKKQGMTVLLKPQVWSWAGWTGEMQMKNEKDWALFFTYYTDWILHYAMLAEMYGADIFCVGVEFQAATTTHESAWREIFSKVRKIYTGKITYAANWGYEFETVSFWDELDYMAINCYYPLSEEQNLTDEELLSAFEKNLEHIEAFEKKFNKPLLFTEIGFKSIDYPWIEPHADNDEQNVNQLSQKRCYEAMFKAMEDEPWIQGIYLWQWPSYMNYIEENPKGFTPCGKLAEAVVEKYFLHADDTK
jgi:hypothetical protein